MADTLTHSMHVEVISPDGPIFSEDNVDMVVARAEDGEFAVLKTICLWQPLWKCALYALKKPLKNRRSLYSAGSWKIPRTT